MQRLWEIELMMTLQATLTSDLNTQKLIILIHCLAVFFLFNAEIALYT